jgi:hypothetical protein
MEEEEALRLQREQAASMRPEDFDDDEEEEEEERTMEEVSQKGKKGKAKGAKAPPQVETIEKDLSAMTEEEKSAVIMSEAPELLVRHTVPDHSHHLEEVQRGFRGL